MQKTKIIKIGNQLIGGDYPIIIQSMANIKTSKVSEVSAQINQLAKAGAKIVRVSILDEQDALAIKQIKQLISVPLVADIHFDYKLAILAIKSGADKIRINPGNIGSLEKIKAVVNCAKEYDIPIRIGINSGSLEKDLYEKYKGVTPEALLESMNRHVNIMKQLNFDNLVLSIKATNIETTIKTNLLLKENFNYPIHIGLTESGTPFSGAIRSSYALGVLLANGVGDTIRVSLNGDPINEIPVAKEILAMHHLYNKPTLICCPTCGRTAYNMVKIVNEIDKFLNNFEKPLKVAIMGCVVNGPGEAKDADIGIAGGNKEAVLFKKGKIIKKIKETDLIDELKKEIINMMK